MALKLNLSLVRLWFYLNSDDNALGWFQTACLDRIAVFPDQLPSFVVAMVSVNGCYVEIGVCGFYGSGE